MKNIFFSLYLEQLGDKEEEKQQENSGSERKVWQGTLKSEASGIKIRYMKGYWSLGKSNKKDEN